MTPYVYSCLFAALAAVSAFGEGAAFTTTADQRLLFARQPLVVTNASGGARINRGKPGQVLEGFGAAFTGSTCFNLLKMAPESRKRLLVETFDRRAGMGYSFIRVSIGASDFSLSEYTLCDKPGIENFGLTAEDTDVVIPVLKQILAVSPGVKITASPWTCPRWMKLNHDAWTGGHLDPKYYSDYAAYFVRYVQAMAANGITIDSVTPQNEPLNPGNSVSLVMTWEEQRDFIKAALGPAFRKAGLKTRIWVFDHNFNYDKKPGQDGYPLKIYADPEAAQYIGGSAWHAYGGSSRELDRIRAAAPGKGIYFTEMSIGGWGYDFGGDLLWAGRELCVGTLNRGCGAVIVWNFLLDDRHAPKRPGGCQNCYGAVDISSADYATLTRRSHFYWIGHLAKVFHPGAHWLPVEGQLPEGVEATAALNPNGTVGVFLVNSAGAERAVILADGGSSVRFTAPAKSVSSLIYRIKE